MKPRLSLTEQVVAFILGHLIGLIFQFTIFLAMQLARVIRWACRSPRVSVPASFLIVVWFAVGSHAAFAIALAATLGLLCWRQLDRDRFNRTFRIQPREVREWSKYYNAAWTPTLMACGLDRRSADAHQIPQLRYTSIGSFTHRLGVSMLPGQVPDNYREQSAALAHAFGAQRCTIQEWGPGSILVDLTRADPLTSPIAALPVSERVDLESLPIGTCEDGADWRVKLLGSHLLIAGSTGAGKGSVLWSLIRSMTPLIRDGLVEVWALDPKGGMELSFGAPLFSRFETAPAEMVEALEAAATTMQERAIRLRGTTRQHVPTRDEPFIVVVVDELASLTAYVTDRDLKKRAHASLQLILSQGRAVGVSVVGALQDPSKEVTPFRDLIPTRIALRLAEDEQIDMVLGAGARKRGAMCDQISTAMAGTGYMTIPGTPDPIRARAAFVTDSEIIEMAAAYRPLVTRQPAAGV